MSTSPPASPAAVVAENRGLLPSHIARSRGAVAAHGVVPVRPGARTALLREFAAITASARAAAGCQDYTAHTDQDQNVVFVYERWASSDQWAEHLLAPATVAFYERVGPLLAGPFDGRFVHPVASSAESAALGNNRAAEGEIA